MSDTSSTRSDGNKFSWRKSCLLLVPVLLFALVLPTLLRITANMAGACVTEGRFLSDQELIRLAAMSANLRQIVFIPAEHKYQEYVPYASVDELVEKNPNCCELGGAGSGEVPGASRFDLLRGINSNFVSVRFFAQYKDDNAAIHKILVHWGAMIGNCGEVVDNWQDITQ